MFLRDSFFSVRFGEILRDFFLEKVFSRDFLLRERIFLEKNFKTFSFSEKTFKISPLQVSVDLKHGVIDVDCRSEWDKGRNYGRKLWEKIMG